MDEAKAPDGESDEQVVRRVLGGDAAAVARLFERHLPALRATVRARFPQALRSKVSDADLLQEAYLGAFLRLPGFEDRGEGSFRRWLTGILRHKIDDEARRFAPATRRDARREVALDARSSLGDLLARLTSPSSRAAAGEQRDALLRALEALPEDHRTVLRLVHWDGLTLVAAGERMGRSGDAARKLYGRALAALATHFQGSAGRRA